MMVSNLPLEWVCAYLISMRVGWTDALLGGMKAYDRGQICNLLCGYLNCSPMLKLGKYGGHKLVAKHAFDMRRQSISPRFASIKSEATATQSVDDVGFVSFGDVGIYTLVTGADKLAHEDKHQPMRDVAAVTSKHIDESWFMARNFSDSKAVIQMDGSKTVKHLLCDYFGKNAGPNKEPQLQGKSKVWESLMDHQRVEANKRVATEGTVAKPDMVLHDATKAAQQESAKRARERMHAKPEEKPTRARVCVAPTTT